MFINKFYIAMTLYSRSHLVSCTVQLGCFHLIATIFYQTKLMMIYTILSQLVQNPHIFLRND